MNDSWPWLENLRYVSEVDLAIAFCLYWALTLQKALVSYWAYIRRSLVVAAYTLLTWGDQRPFVSNAEWIAWGMVWCHWLGAVQTFFYPDPRFRRLYEKQRP